MSAINLQQPLTLCIITVGMNCLNPQRNKEVEPRRAFGKDITNIAKGHQGDNQLKKGLVAVVTQSNHIGVKLRQPNDAINDYHQQIFAFISTYPQKAVGQACGEVTDKMRQILVDWLVEVHQSFKLKDQTLFLALQYLQEYQSLISISKEQYQLVGIACLWIASKHEEIYPPRMKEFVDVTACTYNRTQLMAMEGKIIQVMQFNLNRVTPLALLSTLELPSFGNAENARSLSLAQYVLELSYLGGSVPRKYSLKTMVMAAVKLGDAVCKKDTNMGYFTCELGDSQFYACHKELALLLQVENKYKLTAIKRKYQKEKYNCVGKISIKYQN